MSENQTTSVTVTEPLTSTPEPTLTPATPPAPAAPPAAAAPVTPAEPATPPAEPPATRIEPQATPSLTPETFQGLAQVYTEKGGQSEEFTQAVQAEGIDPALALSYIAGQQALQAQQDTKLFEMAGGQAAYGAMAQWAQTNLSEAAANAYNAALDSGNIEQAGLAVAGLKAQYEQAVGRVPNLASASPNAGVTNGFSSEAEWLDAMKAKDNSGRSKYEHDEGYRAQIMNRLEQSTFFNN